jgi:hypothetical protein
MKWTWFDLHWPWLGLAMSAALFVFEKRVLRQTRTLQ